ncbi:NADP-dependent alcohol dehydrogenase [Bacteroides luti]|uniref:NADP-dependent alcohol dehydrogenase n=1 Tax=Bacteroides luti TaxID=1297750 RepID=A0A1M5BLD4_9BACE|nr:iron-containing alcohol dehydrogenase [Bacteroides luti]SHF43364.1 NADP-dependent alcohol dehydrogenase [Bacteroides luti]
MYNFTFQNPTKLVFGKGEIAQLSTLIPTEKKVMITFGGGSVKHNGVYEQVIAALKNHNYIEFWGIEPNPEVETVRKAVALGKENEIDFLLAVGGGSVLDGTKLIASALANPGIDPWDIVLQRRIETAISYASVMTLPATGSEMNCGSVISCREKKEKYAFSTTFPEFSILDPEVTYSLPANQIACGLADIFVHVAEQYMTTAGQSRIMDRWAEGVLQTVIEIAPKIKENQNDYDVMADYMLSATLALNSMISMGVTQDWATHMIGHELTALHGLTHGASLAIVYPGTLITLKEQKQSKILQYGERVLGITSGTESERINETISKTEAFFRSLGLATRLTEVGIGDETINLIAERFNKIGVAYGEGRNVTGDVAKQILLNCK